MATEWEVCALNERIVHLRREVARWKESGLGWYRALQSMQKGMGRLKRKLERAQSTKRFLPYHCRVCPIARDCRGGFSRMQVPCLGAHGSVECHASLFRYHLGMVVIEREEKTDAVVETESVGGCHNQTR